MIQILQAAQVLEQSGNNNITKAALNNQIFESVSNTFQHNYGDRAVAQGLIVIAVAP